MKGTAPRDHSPEVDRCHEEQLAKSEKDRAENLMIVDMIRNDLGRIAKTGSVHCTKLFQIERYPSVFQMTSTIEAEVAGKLPEIFGALFPCASIVGAPKISTMGLIAQLEPSARGVYTGAIGWVAPGSRSCFSVAIRTMTASQSSSSVSYGVGSGLIWDSKCEAEWQECLLKAKALDLSQPTWGLIETLRWTEDEGYYLLEEHLNRMQRSANELGIDFPEHRLREALNSHEATLSSAAKVRLTLLPNEPKRSEHRKKELERNEPTSTCEVTVRSEQLVNSALPLTARLAISAICSSDPQLKHKTNRRNLYSRFITDSAFNEALLWNERQELTEFCNGSLVVLLEGRYLTPPLECGLLPGVMREQLIRAGKIEVQKIPIGDLVRSEGVYRINSVRGWQEVNLYRS
jgi:para-aminobenzoate synthetase/4-amino-4-deoxychorismate lyase